MPLLTRSLITCILLLMLMPNVRAQDTIARPGFKLIFEKTYLHTDRDPYAPGDTLWFKVYLLNAQDNSLINSSNNLHVELISPDARILLTELIRMDGGLGHGDIALPDTLVPGQYRLRAYTNWMRNFGDNFIFEKVITLVSTAGTSEVGTAKSNISATTAAKVAATATATITSPTIRFFPEGGSLVEGISSIVAVKAETGQVSGAIVSAPGDTVTHFSTDSLGMGLLAMLPVKGQTYHAVVNGAVYAIPLALANGFAMQVRQTDSVVMVKVGYSGNERPACSIIVKHAGTTILKQQLTPAQNLLKIPSVDLPEGIAAITLFDEQNKPHAERLVYIHHPNTIKTIISTDKKSYQPKEKTILQITAEPNTNLSLAVVDAETTPVGEDNIVADLLLSSELRGHIDHAAGYFDTTNVNRFKQLDMLLLTQGWREYIWRRLADTAIRISYAAERNIDIPGRLRDEVSNKYLPGVKIGMYLPGIKRIAGATTDANGKFVMTGISWQGKQSVEFTALNAENKKVGSFMLDTIIPPVVTALPKVALKNIVADPMTDSVVEQRAAVIRSAKLNGVTQLKEVKIKAKPTLITRNTNLLTTLGYPDQIFNIKPEDEKYKTLEWYLMQNVKGAQKSSMLFHGIIPTGVVFPGVDTLGLGIHGKYTMMPPLIFVNGQELNMDENEQAENYRQTFFYMPLNKFSKIVLKHMVGTIHGMAFGNKQLSAQQESVIVDRYLLYLTMNDSYMTDNPGSITKDIQGYYEARNFYQPLPSAKPSLADYRSTIYWTPDVKTDATGKATVSFYNALPQTTVRVVVQGITAKGVPVAASATYQVK